jgi:hypothetical protein
VSLEKRIWVLPHNLSFLSEFPFFRLFLKKRKLAEVDERELRQRKKRARFEYRGQCVTSLAHFERNETRARRACSFPDLAADFQLLYFKCSSSPFRFQLYRIHM